MKESVRIADVAAETESGYHSNKCPKPYPLQPTHWAFGVVAHEKEINKDMKNE
jgi:hypothetical protein